MSGCSTNPDSKPGLPNAPQRRWQSPPSGLAAGRLLKPDQTNAREDAVTSVQERLGRIEGLLNEVLHVLRDRKRRAGKRARTVGENAFRSVANDTSLQATEMEIAAARRILRKRGTR